MDDGTGCERATHDDTEASRAEPTDEEGADGTESSANDAKDNAGEERGSTTPNAWEQLPDPVFTLDSDGRIAGWNSAFEAVVDSPSRGQKPTAVFTKHSADQLEAAVDAARTGAERRVVVDVRGDGTPALEARVTDAAADVPGAVVAVGRERTAEADSRPLKHREQALRRAYDIIGNREWGLDRKVRALLALVKETLGTEFASLTEVEGDSLRFRAFDGPENTPVDEGDAVPLSTTNCERVVATEQTLVLNNISEDAPELAARAGNRENGTESYLGAPVVVDGETYGTFCFFDTAPREEGFSEWEVTFVDLLSGWVSSRIEREQLLERQYSQYFETLLEQSADMVVVLDSDGERTFVSPSVERVLGYAPETFRSADILKYVHPDDEAQVEQFIEELGRPSAGSETTEYRVRDADGEWRWIETRGRSELGDPLVEGIVLNSRDITERKRRELELKNERRLTEHIFESLPDIFYAFDEEGSFLRWSDELADVTGYSDDEIDTMRPWEFFAPEHQDTIAGAVTRVVEEDAVVTVEAPIEAAEGGHIPYEFTGARMTDEAGETIGIVGIGRNITDRKKRERRFEAVFNNTFQFTGLMEPDGTLIEANETALEFGGLDREDVVGSKLWETYWFEGTDEGPAIASEAVETARDGELYRTELQVKGETGTEIIDFSVRPVTDDSGAVKMLIPEGRTVTDLKRREQHLDVLHRFLRHNIRNKMNVIDGAAELLADALESTDHEADVEMITDATTELLKLTETGQRLASVAVDDDYEKRPVDAAAVADRTVTELRSQFPSATIDLSVEERRTVLADSRLGVIIEELVENAVEHAPHDDPTIEVIVSEAGRGAAVSVVDDGTGIPEEELVGITTNEEPTQTEHGTGFGLWVVRAVVDDYGGDLDYSRTDDGGSRMTVTVPERAIKEATSD